MRRQALSGGAAVVIDISKEFGFSSVICLSYGEDQHTIPLVWYSFSHKKTPHFLVEVYYTSLTNGVHFNVVARCYFRCYACILNGNQINYTKRTFLCAVRSVDNDLPSNSMPTEGA